jgi:hypothetical protein
MSTHRRYDAPLAIDSTCACSDTEAKGSWVDTGNGPRFAPTAPVAGKREETTSTSKGYAPTPKPAGAAEAARGDAVNPVDAAQARADAEQRANYASAAPAGALARAERTAPAAPSAAVVTDGMTPIEAAQARADAEHRASYASVAPAGASVRRK